MCDFMMNFEFLLVPFLLFVQLSSARQLVPAPSIEETSCSFEDSFCSWYPKGAPKGSNVRWRLSNSSIDSRIPEYEGSGFLVLHDTGGSNKLKGDILWSPLFTWKTPKVSLSMLIYCGDDTELEMHLLGDILHEYLGEVECPRKNAWNFVIMPLQYLADDYREYQITFNGFVRRSPLALKHVKFMLDPAPSTTGLKTSTIASEFSTVSESMSSTTNIASSSADITSNTDEDITSETESSPKLTEGTSPEGTHEVTDFTVEETTPDYTPSTEEETTYSTDSGEETRVSSSVPETTSDSTQPETMSYSTLLTDEATDPTKSETMSSVGSETESTALSTSSAKPLIPFIEDISCSFETSMCSWYSKGGTKKSNVRWNISDSDMQLDIPEYEGKGFVLLHNTEDTSKRKMDILWSEPFTWNSPNVTLTMLLYCGEDSDLQMNLINQDDNVHAHYGEIECDNVDAWNYVSIPLQKYLINAYTRRFQMILNGFVKRTKLALKHLKFVSDQITTSSTPKAEILSTMPSTKTVYTTISDVDPSTVDAMSSTADVTTNTEEITGSEGSGRTFQTTTLSSVSDKTTDYNCGSKGRCTKSTDINPTDDTSYTWSLEITHVTETETEEEPTAPEATTLSTQSTEDETEPTLSTDTESEATVRSTLVETTFYSTEPTNTSTQQETTNSANTFDEVTQSQNATSSTPPTETTLPWIEDISCPFETSMCSWYSKGGTKKSEVRWRLRDFNEEVDIPDFGGKGFVMLYNTEDDSSGRMDILWSEPFTWKSPNVTLNMMMYCGNDTELQMNLIDEKEIHGHYGEIQCEKINEWNYVYISLYKYLNHEHTRRFQITFNGEVKKSPLAIKLLHFIDHETTTIAFTTAEPTSTQRSSSVDTTSVSMMTTSDSETTSATEGKDATTASTSVETSSMTPEESTVSSSSSESSTFHTTNQNNYTSVSEAESSSPTSSPTANCSTFSTKPDTLSTDIFTVSNLTSTVATTQETMGTTNNTMPSTVFTKDSSLNVTLTTAELSRGTSGKFTKSPKENTVPTETSYTTEETSINTEFTESTTRATEFTVAETSSSVSTEVTTKKSIASIVDISCSFDETYCSWYSQEALKNSTVRWRLSNSEEFPDIPDVGMGFIVLKNGITPKAKMDLLWSELFTSSSPNVTLTMWVYCGDGTKLQAHITELKKSLGDLDIECTTKGQWNFISIDLFEYLAGVYTKIFQINLHGIVKQKPLAIRNLLVFYNQPTTTSPTISPTASRVSTTVSVLTTTSTDATTSGVSSEATSTSPEDDTVTATQTVNRTSSPLTVTETTNPPKPFIEDLSCSFEFSMCSWYSYGESKGSKVRWMVSNSSRDSAIPEERGNGYLVLRNTDSGKRRKVDILYSRRFSWSSPNVELTAMVYCGNDSELHMHLIDCKSDVMEYHGDVECLQKNAWNNVTVVLYDYLNNKQARQFKMSLYGMVKKAPLALKHLAFVTYPVVPSTTSVTARTAESTYLTKSTEEISTITIDPTVPETVSVSVVTSPVPMNATKSSPTIPSTIYSTEDEELSTTVTSDETSESTWPSTTEDSYGTSDATISTEEVNGTNPTTVTESNETSTPNPDVTTRSPIVLVHHLSCSFNHSFCLWYSQGGSNRSKVRWEISNSTQNPDIAQEDGEGFVVLRNAVGDSKTIDTLWSPLFMWSSPNVTLSFSVYCGSGTELHLTLVDKANKVENKYGQIHCFKENSWNYIHISLYQYLRNNNSHQFQAALTGIAGKSPLAIKNLNVISSNSSLRTSQATPSTETAKPTETDFTTGEHTVHTETECVVCTTPILSTQQSPLSSEIHNETTLSSSNGNISTSSVSINYTTTSDVPSSTEVMTTSVGASTAETETDLSSTPPSSTTSIIESSTMSTRSTKSSPVAQKSSSGTPETTTNLSTDNTIDPLKSSSSSRSTSTFLPSESTTRKMELTSIADSKTSPTSISRPWQTSSSPVETDGTVSTERRTTEKITVVFTPSVSPLVTSTGGIAGMEIWQLCLLIVATFVVLLTGFVLFVKEKARRNRASNYFARLDQPDASRL